ncbi:diguanylate cyclase [Gallaecimonas sp. GXIMD4217]|uniref:GGDEF domain-containing protein n=1 Tax=Gallaecimonas sp. GXIMD4217 TaxID=3131927 RepID=UPI00311ACF7E
MTLAAPTVMQPSWPARRVLIGLALLVLAVFTVWDIVWLGWSHPLLQWLLSCRFVLQWLPLLSLFFASLHTLSEHQFRRQQWWCWVLVGLGTAIITVLPAFHQLPVLSFNGQFILLLFGFFVTTLHWPQKLAAALIVILCQLGLVMMAEGFSDQWLNHGIYLGMALVVGGVASVQHDQLVEAVHDQTKRLRHMAETDALTGIDNRYRFERHLDTLIDQGAPFALAIIDVDHFKAYNDEAGHLAGDQCLASLAKLLSDDGHQHLARYGGEEFVAWQPVESFEEAEAWGEALVAKVRNAQMLHPCSPQGPWLTVSVGVTLAQDSNRRAILSRADAALYEAKAQGRDRAVFKVPQGENA